MRQEEHIKKLLDIGSGPLYGATSFLQNEKFVPGKRFFIEHAKYPIDYRTVFSNEIIFELDDRSYASNYKYAKKVLDVLNKYNIPRTIYASGGKGIHIHIFFDKIEFETNEQKELFNQCLEKGLKFQHIRKYVFDKIFAETYLNDSIVGVGKIFDTSCLTFDDENARNKLIRVCGGRKLTYDKITQETEQFYKTYIPEDEFNKTKIRCNTYEQVKFPEEVETFKINVYDFCAYLKEFLKMREHFDKTDQRLELTCQYIDLPGVKKIREGMPVGLRAEGAKVLSIALRNDKVSYNYAKKEIENYAHNCSQIGEEFTTSEAIQWLNWVYNQPEIFWNPGLLKNLGSEYYTEDEYVKKLNKQSYDILKSSDVLARIDEFLGKTIVGEEKNRMLIFLLLLSNKFIVDETWNVPGDPKPASVILSSSSSSGKSYTTKNILRLFGTEGQDYYSFSRMTTASINYFGDIDMNNKIMFIEELQGLDESSNQLRVWISEGKLKLTTVEKVQTPEGEVNSLVIRQSKGQPVFITGTAEDSIEEQMSTRSWIISLDISKNQTSKILKYIDNLSHEKTNFNLEELRLLQDAIKSLKSYHYIVPFMNYEALNIPQDDVRMRRDYQKLRDLICASACLHQYQRDTIEDKYGNKYVVADYQDYDIARFYAMDVLFTTFLGLSKIQWDTLKAIESSGWAEEFTSSDVQRMMGWSQTKTWRVLEQLCETGFLWSEKQFGQSAMYHYNHKKRESTFYLPTSDELKEKLGTYSVDDQKTKIYYQPGIKVGKKYLNGIAPLADVLKGQNFKGNLFTGPIPQQRVLRNLMEKYSVEYNQNVVCDQGAPSGIGKVNRSDSEPKTQKTLVSDQKGILNVVDADQISKVEKAIEKRQDFSYEEIVEECGEKYVQSIIDSKLLEGSIQRWKNDRYLNLT